MKFFTLALLGMIATIANLNAQAQRIEKINNSDDVVKTINTSADGDVDEADEVSTTGCGGVERWSEKVLTDALANTVVFTPNHSTVAHLVAINTPAPNSTMPRYPSIEDSTYTITCNITIKKAESDSDFHLVLSNGTQTMIGEIPCTNCNSVAVSQYVNLFQTCRDFINAHIASGNVMNVNIPAVTVTGVAFIDPPHGQTGAAPNNLELHPIIDIHFASATVAPAAIMHVSGPICGAGQPVTLTDNSLNNPTSWSWTMPGGSPSSSTLQNPTVTYSATGTYTVSLVASNASGSSTPALQTIIVNPVATVPTITLNGAVLSTSSTSVLYQWYFNNAPIPGATAQSYTETANGNYYVVITNVRGCTAASVVYTVTTTGIQEFADGTTFQIYPNPAKNNITIETKENNMCIVYITNTLGQQIIKKYFRKKSEVDLSSFGKGIYNVEVCDESGVKCHSQRVIVE